MRHQFETLSDMVLFVEVARCASFRNAALRLNMPAATLSRRLAAMETRLGVQLLVRTTRSVSLAQGAKQYFDQCVRVLEAASAAQSVLSATLPNAERIRISMPIDLGVEILGPAVADYVTQHPGLVVDFDLSTQARDLFRDPVDLVFRIGRPLDERVVARKIWDVAGGIFASPALLERLGRPTVGKDLLRMPCLELMTAVGPMAWKVSGQSWAKAPGQVAMTANSMGLLVALTVRGHGLALLPRHLVITEVRAGSLVEISGVGNVPPWPLFAITATRSVSAHMKGLLAHVRARLPR